jgi:phosphatidylserine decarboxylase
MILSTKKSLLNYFADTVGINKKFSKRGTDNINKSSKVIVSPVDATLFCYGSIDSKGNIISKHGKKVSLSNLIGKYSDKFCGGTYLNLYLSPKNKHYFVFPYDGTVKYIQKNEGKAFIPIIIGLDNIFGNQTWFSKAAEKNASIGIIVDTEKFSYAIIAVGSLNVNNISVNCEIGKKYKKGSYFGHFSIGSTIILCLDKNIKNNKSKNKISNQLCLNKGEHVTIGKEIVIIK